MRSPKQLPLEPSDTELRVLQGWIRQTIARCCYDGMTLQGTSDYLDATLENMRQRGLANPKGSPNELELTMMIEDARASGNLIYAEVKGITPE